MKRTALVLLFIPLFGFAQTSMTQVEMKSKLDSILLESEILYRYEKSAISAITFATSDKKLRNNFIEVFTYTEGDTVKAIILSKDRKMCLSELSFCSDYALAKTKNVNARILSEKELRLLTIRQMIFNDISKKGYEIKGLQDYELHSILIPADKGYKLYIVTATYDKDMIPYGNDYLFNADRNGTVTSYEKFHSRLIPTPTKYNGNKVVSSMHTHLETTPFITATDICTFRIYGAMCGQQYFEVLSIALDKIFKYDLEKNQIEIEDMPK
jgi:hypothetical protein